MRNLGHRVDGLSNVSCDDPHVVSVAGNALYRRGEVAPAQPAAGNLIECAERPVEHGSFLLVHLLSRGRSGQALQPGEFAHDALVVVQTEPNPIVEVVDDHMHSVIYSIGVDDIVLRCCNH